MTRKDAFAGALLLLFIMSVVAVIAGYAVKFFVFSVLYLGVPLMTASLLGVFVLGFIFEGVIKGRSKNEVQE